MDTRKKTRFLILAALAIGFTFSLCADGLLAADLGTRLAEQYLKKIPITQLEPNLTMEQAARAQVKFLEIISKDLGEPVGYKAGLTTPNVPKVFGVSEPVRGTLLSKMILNSGAVVPADFGTFPFSEGDLIMRVGNEAVNQAKTQMEALASMDAVIPFIELGDLTYDIKVAMPNGPALVAIDVGPRLGIVGEPIPVAATQEWIDRLRDFTLQINDEQGKLVGEGKGSAFLGHPLNVVLWIKNSLASEGKKLKKGDLLSLGSATKMIPTKAGSALKARYIGLDPKGPVEISVSFK